MGGINMYCKKCGAEIPDDVKFCLHCGAPVEESAKPVEPAPEQPGKILIAPAILAGLALLFSLYGVISSQIAMSSFGSSFLFTINRLQSLVSYLFTIAAEVFVLLYCLLQAKKRKASLFGAASLMLVLRAFAGIVFMLVITTVNRRAINVQTALILDAVDVVFELAAIVLFLIAAIFAFRNRIAKTVVIIGASVLIVSALVVRFVYLESAANLVNLIFALLLPVAVLLVGILAKKK